MAKEIKEILEHSYRDADYYQRKGIAMLGGLVDTMVKEGLLPSEVPHGSQFIGIDTIAERLNKLRETYKGTSKKTLDTPTFQTFFWRDLYSNLGINDTIPECDWTEKEIKEPLQDFRGDKLPAMMVYRHDKLAGDAKRIPFLHKLIDITRTYETDSGEFVDNYDCTGWAKVESDLMTPNIGLNIKKARDFAKDQGYQGQRIGTYAVASLANYCLTGHFFDVGRSDTGNYSFSKLLGSDLNNEAVLGYFVSKGSLDNRPMLILSHANIHETGYGSRHEVYKQ